MAHIREFGCWLPERVVTNHETAGWVGSDPQWIQSVSGIEQRRFAREDETVAEMAALAGRDCLSRANMEPGNIKMILVATGSSERAFPGPAAETALRLGIPGVPSIDISAASAGALIALTLAFRVVDIVGPILVIASEKMSTVVRRQQTDRGVAILFGDGAGAVLVTPSYGKLRLIDAVLGSDGSFAGDLYLFPGQPLQMNGRSVILQACRKVPEAIRAVLRSHAVRPEHVHTFLMHQANQNLTLKVAQALNVSPDRFFSNIERYGNTSSASMLIAAAEWSRQATLSSADAVVFAAFGAGFHWGALLARAV